MSEEQPTTGESEGVSYTPSQLPPPVSTGDFYLRALIVELRVLNRAVSQLVKASQAQAKATEAGAKAQQDQARSSAKAVKK